MRGSAHTLWALALALGACGGRPVVRATFASPPELPVRVFPEIAVVDAGAPEDVEIADALARHLAAASTAGPSARVTRLDETHLALRRASGDMGVASAVLQVRTRIAETMRPTLVTRPQTVCGPWGCTTEQRPVFADVPVIVGTLVLRVSEGRSEALLQELRFEAREEGGDPLAMRLRVVDRLRRRALEAVDPQRREVVIELVETDDPVVGPAVRAMLGGRPDEARALLAAIARRDDFDDRPAPVRARVLFVLGQARRLAARIDATIPDEEQDRRLHEAEDAIRRAIALDPQARYARALAQIEDERQALLRARELRDAAAHNFALERDPSIPEPPPGYR